MTKALYYPTIDITNEDWLKTAILFWDEINTIVPESIHNPYREVSTQYLSDEGILRPLPVNPEMDLIEDLTNDTLNYLNTNEGFQLLMQGQGAFSAIHRDKLPYEIDRIYRIHNEKLPYLIREIIEEKLDSRICNKAYSDNNWLYVDYNFADFYMTLLANKLAEINSIALLTDNSFSSNLADKARLNNQIAISRNDNYYRNRHKEKSINLTQGLLTNLIIESVRINPTSSLEKIIDFKRQHGDELGLFRTNLVKLTQNVSKEKSIEAIRQEVQDIYKDEFIPAYNNLKKALNSSGIKWIAENCMKVSVFSASATAVPTALLGFSTPTAIFAGLGVSLTTSLISYNSDKRKIIRENPYSYLLAINNEIVNNTDNSNHKIRNWINKFGFKN
ncbi:hypothetical protein FACS189437_03270 [Bacteroidia bacterium]|nr:hypothetical protein FACS189437_03270 [Bacteroidia bacterium]